MIDPFDDVRDQLVLAIARLEKGPSRAARWRRVRSHPIAVALAALVFAGTATAAVISISSERSEPLAGQVPRQAGPGSAHAFWGLEGGEHYRITVWPVLQGGVSGVCSMIVFEGPHGVGSGSCGAPYPTTSMPYLAPGGRTAYPGGIIAKGGALEYFLTGPGVAAVRIGAHLIVTPRSEPGLPAGDRAVVFYLPAGSPEIDPPWFPTEQLGLPRGAKTSVVAVGRSGAPIPVDRGAQQFRLPARYWERPETPPSGACALAAPPGYRAFRGTTALRLEPEREVEGAALTSCLSVDYKADGTTLTAAVLVNARSPMSAPPALFGASPVPGQPGLVSREEDTGLHTGTLIAFTARRDGNAWIVVEGGRGVAQRIRAVRALRVARIDVSGVRGSSG